MVDQIIAIIGLNGAGKTTTATKLKNLFEQLGINAEVESFAKPLKNVASKCLGYQEERKNSGHREILEQLAASMRSELWDDVFSEALIKRIINSNKDVIIIDDMRFLPEYVYISTFMPITIIQMPIRDEICDELSFNRLNTLKRFFDSNQIEYFEPKDVNSTTLKAIICTMFDDGDDFEDNT